MKTIFKIKTWGCECGYHIDKEIIGLCPACRKHSKFLETVPFKQATVTIMGEEEIKEDEDKVKVAADIKASIIRNEKLRV